MALAGGAPLVELPVATLSFFGRSLPVAGGGYHRAGGAVGRQAHPHGGQPGAHGIGDAGRLGQYQCKRARPKGVGQQLGFPWESGHHLRQPVQHINVYDHRVVFGAALGLEHPGSGFGVQRVGGQAIYRLGGNGHRLAGAQKLGGQGNGLFAGW